MENITVDSIVKCFDLTFLPDYDQDKKPVLKWSTLLSGAAMIITIVLVEIY